MAVDHAHEDPGLNLDVAASGYMFAGGVGCGSTISSNRVRLEIERLTQRSGVGD